LQIKFRDRSAAGEILALMLKKYKRREEQPILIIGIPRGGVVVADVVARKLSAGFDIVIPRKLRAPDNSENAIGAIMPDGSVYLDALRVESLKVSNEYIEMEKSEQKKAIDRRMTLYRPQSKEYKIRGRTVILVDDGAATGATIIAAARWIRKQGPKHLIIALPVAPKHKVDLLKNEAESVQVITSPSNFRTVEQFYQDFGDVTDQQVTSPNFCLS
jgi:putative phosphoribosyl transferase